MKQLRAALIPIWILCSFGGFLGTSKSEAADALARSVSAPREVSYKGAKIAQVFHSGRSTQVRAKVYHRKPDKTRTEYIAPPSVAGTIILDIGQDRWQYFCPSHCLLR